MRVLHVGKFYPPVAGGIENFLGDLLPALEKMGVSAAALVHDDPNGGATPDTGLPRIYWAPCSGTLLYAPVSPMFPKIMAQAIREFRPDILHLHVPNTSAFWALVLPAARKIPWVIHWHADVISSQIDRRMALAYQIYRPVERLFLQHATCIITTSRAYLDSSPTLARFRNKCRVAPLGLDHHRVDVPTAEDRQWADQVWGRTGHRILVVGRLTYYKGHDVVLNAMSELPEAKLVVVGDGERETSLRRQIAANGLDDRVRLTGLLPEYRLHALMATCDCLCLPSIERTEAFGLVLLEAMRFAKPVVASDIPGSGVGWVVDHGVTGLLVRPGHAGDLAAALHTVLDSPAVKLHMGQAALDRFYAHFQIDPVASQIVLAYKGTWGEGSGNRVQGGRPSTVSTLSMTSTTSTSINTQKICQNQPQK